MRSQQWTTVYSLVSRLNTCETNRVFWHGKYTEDFKESKSSGVFHRRIDCNSRLTLSCCLSWRNSCAKNMLLEYRFIASKRNMAAVWSQTQCRDVTFLNTTNQSGLARPTHRVVRHLVVKFGISIDLSWVGRLKNWFYGGFPSPAYGTWLEDLLWR